MPGSPCSYVPVSEVLVNCRCTIGLNVALMVLFLSLAITFFLLAAGVTHHRANKVFDTLCGKFAMLHHYLDAPDIALSSFV